MKDSMGAAACSLWLRARPRWGLAMSKLASTWPTEASSTLLLHRDRSFASQSPRETDPHLMPHLTANGPPPIRPLQRGQDSSSHTRRKTGNKALAPNGPAWLE
jgi:hypothetical protein